MNDLFSRAGLDQRAPRPLADLLRPERLSALVGQEHLTGPSGAIGGMLRRGQLASMILWGPPGVGKTSLARLLAQETDLAFESLSAIFSGVKDLRAVFDRATARRTTGQGSLLFVDEIHRFNRAQQDSFLPFVESGTVILIGATTENPSFALNPALLSRCQVMTLERLRASDLEKLLARAEDMTGRPVPLDADARGVLLQLADGDGRYLLNLAEQVFSLPETGLPLGADALLAALRRKAPAYDQSGDHHYNLVSALHKSVRASDPDAALYWLARMLRSGEDPLFIARRLIRIASEDVGLADPTSLMIASEAARGFERLGSPEGDLLLAHAVIHLATAPKSNAACLAWERACRAADETGSLGPRLHSLNAPTGLMRELGYGHGYVYDHDAPDSFSGQDHFPEGMSRQAFYTPGEAGRERGIAERLNRLALLRSQKERLR